MMSAEDTFFTLVLVFPVGIVGLLILISLINKFIPLVAGPLCFGCAVVLLFLWGFSKAPESVLESVSDREFWELLRPFLEIALVAGFMVGGCVVIMRAPDEWLGEWEGILGCLARILFRILWYPLWGILAFIIARVAWFYYIFWPIIITGYIFWGE